jgi:iron complex transport system substrate-binding protein
MIALAGGRDVIGTPGERSRLADWDEIAAAAPELALVMPCGLYVDDAAEQADRARDRFQRVGAARVVAVDAASSFSRPGPRLVDGVELLAHLFHPGRVAAPDGLGWREIAWESAAPSSRSR